MATRSAFKGYSVKIKSQPAEVGVIEIDGVRVCIMPLNDQHDKLIKKLKSIRFAEYKYYYDNQIFSSLYSLINYIRRSEGFRDVA